jgi:hypothetical protein
VRYFGTSEGNPSLLPDSVVLKGRLFPLFGIWSPLQIVTTTEILYYCVWPWIASV